MRKAQEASNVRGPGALCPRRGWRRCCAHRARWRGRERRRRAQPGLRSLRSPVHTSSRLSALASSRLVAAAPPQARPHCGRGRAVGRAEAGGPAERCRAPADTPARFAGSYSAARAPPHPPCSPVPPCSRPQAALGARHSACAAAAARGPAATRGGALCHAGRGLAAGWPALSPAFVDVACARMGARLAAAAAHPATRPTARTFFTRFAQQRQLQSLEKEAADYPGDAVKQAEYLKKLNTHDPESGAGPADKSKAASPRARARARRVRLSPPMSGSLCCTYCC